jgi:hypothetical protein
LYLACCAAVSAFAGQDATKKQLQAQYDRAGGILIQQDVKGFVKFLQETRTPGYAYITKHGKYHLDKLMQSMAMVLSTYRVTKSSVKIEKIKVTGDTADVTVTTVTELETRPTKSQQKHKLEQEVHGEDSWIKLDGVWKLKMSQVTSEHIMQDGQLVK